MSPAIRPAFNFHPSTVNFPPAAAAGVQPAPPPVLCDSGWKLARRLALK